MEEAIAAGKRELSAWYNKLWWPHLIWFRKCCVALEECKFDRVPDDMSVELDHITMEPSTTLNIENTFNMDCLAFWHRTTHAGLLREADKEMLEVLPEDIIASPRSVPLGMFDSWKFEFSFFEKFLDSSMEDSVALPVFTR